MTLGRQQIRRDTAANWAANNPTLADGEIGECTDINFIKIGDGATAWNSLSAFVGRIVTTSIKTANYTAGPWELIPVDATSGAVVITLPTAPVAGTQIYVKRNDASANSVTVVCGGTDRYNIPGGTQTQSLYFTNYGFLLQYSSSLGLWFQVAVVMPVGQLDARYVNTATATTKGDIYAATAASTLARLAVGSNGQVLAGASGQSTGLQYVSIPWCPEMVCTSAAVADGYNDMPGGISVEPGINAAGVSLDSIWLRVGDLATSNSGGDLICDVYGGTKSTQGTLIASITLTNGSQDVVSTLGSPYALAANAVVRAYFTKGSSTVAKPLHVQLRGRYVG